ncbi:hypothetical protein [Photobacterium damselae]|uniref:hypothetical protein n=1 Tax=Photobacterium damselae TaxID=38293 RepID=UPI004068FE66
MSCSNPFPGQTTNIFKDKFCKWPRLLQISIVLSFLPIFAVLIAVKQNIASLQSLSDTIVVMGFFNIFLLAWGLILFFKARKHWYRNYHIGKSLLVAVLPIFLSGYILINDLPDNRTVQQETSKVVEFSIN